MEYLNEIRYYQCSVCHRAFETEAALHTHVEPGGHGPWMAAQRSVYSGGFYTWAPTNTNITIATITKHDNGDVWVACRDIDGDVWPNDYSRFLEACFPSILSTDYDVEREVVPDSDDEWKRKEPIIKVIEIDAIVHKLGPDSVLLIRLPEEGHKQAGATQAAVEEYLTKMLGRPVPVIVLAGHDVQVEAVTMEDDPPEGA